MVVEVVGHDGGGVLSGEDETLCEGGIKTTMLGLGEPDEVGGTVVGGDAVEVVAIVGTESTFRELGGWR